MSFINSSIAINGSFNTESNTSIYFDRSFRGPLPNESPMNATNMSPSNRKADRSFRGPLPDDSLINSIEAFSNESPMNATNMSPSNRKIDKVAKVKIGNGFTDPKYGNIPRSKRIHARHTRSIPSSDIPPDLSFSEKNSHADRLFTCETEKHNCEKELRTCQEENRNYKEKKDTCAQEKHNIISDYKREICQIQKNLRGNLEKERDKCRKEKEKYFRTIGCEELPRVMETNQDLAYQGAICNRNLSTCKEEKANLTTTYNITLEKKDREITQLNKQANLTTTSLEEKDQELSSLNETLQRLKDEKNTCEANKANLTTTYNITLEKKDREITQLNKQANLTTTSL
ncbi:hypothetical protein, partial [Candidatus Rhabdochlamydia sp. W815]